MSELRRKAGAFWTRKFRTDIAVNTGSSGSTGLGNGPLGTMPLGGA